MNGYAPAYEAKGEIYAGARVIEPTRADTENVPHIEDEVEVKIYNKEYEFIAESEVTDVTEGTYNFEDAMKAYADSM
jgi:hypothetical protein